MLPQCAPSRDATALHVAGIGASAGGIEAMLPLLASLPVTGCVTYVVAQHMAHNGHSELVARLLGRESTLPVQLANHGERLLADRVYVIPAGKDGQVLNGLINLQEPGSGNLSTPSVSTLFSSIGQACKQRSIGIMLSGTGSDGTAGCRAIRAAGGLTMAQEPSEAKFDGMPTSAIDAKVIDRVLPVQGLAGALAALFPAITPKPGSIHAPAIPAKASAYAGPIGDAKPVDAAPVIETPEQRDLMRLLRLVLDATGIDFSSYKEDTLFRRLDKRKATLGLASAEDYFAFIKRHPNELKTLQELFLVSVSSFFRDPDSFKELERALSTLVASKPEAEPIRIWVPGCASGDECYTLAIIVTELLSQLGRCHTLQITGTDLNPEALALAHAGVYRTTAMRDVEPALRERYFMAHGQHFEVSQTLRDCVKFEQRDVLSGIPTETLDLVSCRNLLIYMKSSLQDQLIKNFQQALRPQGLLFIGQSESLSFLGNSLFAPIDHYHRLFRRRH